MRTIQSRLILSFSVAILVPAIITCYVGMRLISDQVITRAETKAISDLNSAREIYRNKLTEIHSVTRLTAIRSLVRQAVADRDRAFLSDDLQKTRRREQLDILTIVDSSAAVIVRARNPSGAGDTLRADEFISRVARTRLPVVGTRIIGHDELMRESADLAAQARMEVIPTPKASPRTQPEELSGMLLESAVPLFDDNDRFLGVLIGGVLLNRNFEVVDKINQIVHEGQVFEGKEIGTATVFQGDLRISTNVKNNDGTRALGTLVSGEVAGAVLGRGERWVGEAFVVNASYIAAYEPIRDPMGTIIGILYVGVLKEPFDLVLRKTLVTFLGIAFLGILIIVFVSGLLARRLATPLKTLEDISRK
ncbi:MAG TPA: cache domain-containing protein, partial [Bacteroidota bacterium]|nr:cache domain-containing protein [Bacteroidota bacterium]